MLRGNIYMAVLPMDKGSVQGGMRPVIIVQNNLGNTHSPTVQVIPLTSKKKKEMPVHTVISGCGLRTESVVLTEQLTTINKTSLRNYLGTADDEMMERVDHCIAIQLGLLNSLTLQ